MPATGQHGPAVVRWHMPPALCERLLGSDGLRLREWLRDGLAELVKDGPHRTVYLVRLPGLEFYVKHYRLLGWRSRVRELLRPIKAKREYERAVVLLGRGIPVPRPLAWGVEGAGVGPCASWLITEAVAGTQTLLSFLETTLPTWPHR